MFRAALFCAVAAISSTASAALVRIENEIHDFAVLDTDTGCVWLSPEQTQFQRGEDGRIMDYFDFERETQEGGIYEGYHIATLAEIETLFFSSAGLFPGRTVPTQAEMEVMLEVFGRTFGPWPRDEDEQEPSICHGVFDGGDALVSINEGGSNVLISLGSQDDTPLDEFGIWLVQDKPIPEPSTLVVWTVLGAVGVLVFHRRRR